MKTMAEVQSMTDSSIRDVLSDRSVCKDTLVRFVELGASKHGVANDLLFVQFCNDIVARNCDLIFEHAQSPIELVFLNSVLAFFAAHDPTGLEVCPLPEAVRPKDFCPEWEWYSEGAA